MVSPSGGRRAIDVHAHAMPLPLLARLADRGLADLDGVPDGIVRLDPRVSGVGPWAPLPLARSPVRRGRAPVGDGRGRGGPARRLAAAVPVRLDLGRRGASSPTSCGRATTSSPSTSRTRPDRLLGLGSVPLGLPGAADEARRCLDELGLAGHRDRQPRRWSRPRRPRERRAVGAPRRARDVRLPAPQRRAGPEAGRRLVHAAARRLPRRDRHRDRPHGVQRHAGAPPDQPVPGPRRRLPAGPARPDGHGLGAQGGRPDHAAAAERVRRPALLRHRGVQHRRCCAGWWRTSAPGT